MINPAAWRRTRHPNVATAVVDRTTVPITLPACHQSILPSPVPVLDSDPPKLPTIRRGSQLILPEQKRDVVRHFGAEMADNRDGVGGHAPRIGMAQDLTAAGVGLPALMVAGRWKSERMPAHYSRGEVAGRGAVARYYAT